MKPSFFSRLIPLLFAGSLGLTAAFAEGEVGSQAYVFSGYKALDSVTYPSGVGLSNFSGKVVLLVLFRYDCGGCVANAPKLGKLADSLGSGQSGSRFQAIGAEIANGTFAQIQTSYNTQLKLNAPTVNFPLVHVPYDTAIVTEAGAGNLTRWRRYNSLRDVYFVINANGSIRARIEGNRLNAMTTVKYDSLRTQLGAAIAAAPTALLTGSASGKDLRVFRRGAGFQFEAGSASASVKLFDLQGRGVRVLALRGGAATWDGKDANGKAVPFGTYFARIAGETASATLRVNVLP